MTESRTPIRPEDTGARLRAIRELAGLSPREVARAAGLSPREVAAVERGRRRLSRDELRAVAGALNIRPEVLVAGARPAEPPTPTTPDAASANPWPPIPGSRDGQQQPSTALQGSERRRDFHTRKEVEDSWSDVRTAMEGVIHQCMRVSTVGSGDDVLALLDAVEGEIRKLRTDREFQREVARHERTIATARGRGNGASRDAKVANAQAR